MIQIQTLIRDSLKNPLALALIGAVFCFSCLSYSHAAVSQISGSNPYWTNFLSDGVDDQNLDVRDARNRAVASPARRRELKDLFLFKIWQEAVRENLPGLAQLRKILADSINPLSQKIRTAVKGFWNGLEPAALQAAGKAHQLVSLLRMPPPHRLSEASADLSILPIYSSSNQKILPLRC